MPVNVEDFYLWLKEKDECRAAEFKIVCSLANLNFASDLIWEVLSKFDNTLIGFKEELVEYFLEENTLLKCNEIRIEALFSDTEMFKHCRSQLLRKIGKLRYGWDLFFLWAVGTISYEEVKEVLVELFASDNYKEEYRYCLCDVFNLVSDNRQKAIEKEYQKLLHFLEYSDKNNVARLTG